MIRVRSLAEAKPVRPEAIARQQCIRPACGAAYDLKSAHQRCPRCGALLDVAYDWERLPVPERLALFDERRASAGDPLDASGVWRFRELLPFAERDKVLTIGEGQTQLRRTDGVAAYVGLEPGRLFLQYEGLNPSGSFKDNGMTGAFTHANMMGARYAACASTGNTSASLALFAGVSGLLKAVVFVGSGKIAYGKLSQALDYGAATLQIAGDFDDAMRRVQEVCRQTSLYLMNSLNPFRLEGQKAIMYRILEARDWQVPDWIIVPGGNLGNCSAFGKAFAELFELGLIDHIPRLAVINATGANTLYQLYHQQGVTWNGGRTDAARIKQLYEQMDQTGYKPHTVASAIEISRPVNLPKALRALDIMKGVVREVSDDYILEHKALVGRYGFGCEPASGASVAGLHVLLDEGLIDRDDHVVCILTGHELKDPDATVRYHTGIDMKAAQVPPPKPVKGKYANPPIKVADDLDAICKALEGAGPSSRR